MAAARRGPLENLRSSRRSLRLFRRPYRIEHDLSIGGLSHGLCHFVPVIAFVRVVAAQFLSRAQ